MEGAAKTLGLEIALNSRFRERDFAARERGVAGLQDILDSYRGKRVAIGTHGNIMTIIMNHYDPAYDFSFWKQTSKPDIYKLTFEENVLLQVTRLWNE